MWQSSNMQKTAVLAALQKKERIINMLVMQTVNSVDNGCSTPMTA